MATSIDVTDGGATDKAGAVGASAAGDVKYANELTNIAKDAKYSQVALQTISKSFNNIQAP